MKNRRYVIVNSTRFFVFITFMLVFIALLLSLVFNLSKVHSSAYMQNYRIYDVVEGDSLWEISLKTMPDGFDVRRMVYEIKELNDMETSYIYEGESIKIPIVKWI